MNKSLTLILLLSCTSCFKTAEEIRREQQIDTQLEQSSKIIIELNSQVDELKNRLSTTSGKIEEMDHKSQKTKEEQDLTYSQTLAQVSEQVKILIDENQKNKTLIQSLQKEVSAQKDYIKNVTGTLKSLSNDSPAPTQKTSLLAKAHEAFEGNKKDEAYKLYKDVLKENKINAADKNHVYFNLGLLEFWNKKYNDALVYFSKIYTKYPRSSFSPRALLYIARSFDKDGKKEEAKASYQELIKNYPKSNHAVTAKEELK